MGLTKLLASKSDTVITGDGIMTLSARSRLLKGIPYLNQFLYTDTPYWRSLDNLVALFNWYHTNPILYATINIKAREYANMRIKVVNRNTGNVEPISTKIEIPRKLYALFNRPNPLQSRWEFFKQRKIFEEVSGNSFSYGNFLFSKKADINNLVALWNVWPAYMQFKLQGNFFEATRIEDVISGWKFELGTYKKEWEPFEILHKNAPNTTPNKGLIFGVATAEALVRPLSNIDMAYETQNVIMRNRGMKAIITSDKSDDTGSLPLLESEVELVKKRLDNYGNLDHQSQFLFSEMPLKVQTIDQDVKKLGLLETIATEAMVVSNGFGVPEVLLKLYLKGGTFENQAEGYTRLYQGTLIPEADDDIIAISNFLGLEETDWFLMADFSHVSALQHEEKLKEETKKIKSERLLQEVAANVLSIPEYRAEMGYKK